jgi:hypothetical protein
MLCIYEVGYKDVSHEIRSRNAHMQMIQLNEDL